MKKTVLVVICLCCIHLCFSQLILDPFSGLKMEQGNDKQYLTIVFIETGSPADLSPLRLGDRIFRINSEAVSAITDCSEFFRNNKDISMQLEVRRFNDLKITATVQRASIDLFAENIASESELFNMTFPLQIRTLSKDISSEKDKFENLENIVQSSDNPKAYGISQWEATKFCTYNIRNNSSINNEITILADESKSLMDFPTYDFEYISQDESILEKNLLNKFERHLAGFGMLRNTTNPDVLILINFYSGQTEQYVPPQQIISTKIQSYFNWYWGYIPVPVTESKTREGYTKVTYLTNINLKLLDAKAIPTSKVPPVLWAASYSEVSPEKVFIGDCADRVFGHLMLQFPKVVNENCKKMEENTYAYTGVIYDKSNLDVIADVIPASPAYEAGIRKGDVILKISDRKLQEDDNFAIYWKNRSDYHNALRYLYMRAYLKPSNTGLFYSFKSEYEDYLSPQGTPIVFEIKRGGKKMEFKVIPEFKKAVYFEWAGFTL